MASIFGGNRGEKGSLLQNVIFYFSMTAGFAVSFIATPKLYALSVDWAVMSANLGPFLTGLGKIVWFCVVGLLTMFGTNLVLFMSILLGGLISGVISTRLSR